MSSVPSSRSPKKTQLDALFHAEKALMGALSAVKEAEKEIKGDIIDLCNISVEENSEDKENEQVKLVNTLVKQKPRLKIKQEKHDTPPVSSVHLPFKLPKRGMHLQEEAGEEEAHSLTSLPHLLALSPSTCDKESSSGVDPAPKSPVSASTALPFDDMKKKVPDKKEEVTFNGKASAVKVEFIGPPRLDMQNDNKTIKEEDATPSGDDKMPGARSPLLVKVITSAKNINNAITSPLKTKRDSSSATKSTKKEEDQDPDNEAEDKLIVLGKEVNKDEDVLYECTVKPYRDSLGDFSNSHGWLTSAKGVLKLYRHLTTGNTRLVQRNAIGTVKLNLAISSESVWGLQRTEKVVTRFGRSKEVTYVSFFALEEGGWSRIALKVGKGDANNLFERLKEMTN